MNGKLLIISNAALCRSDSNGRNLSRLVDCIEKQRKAQFFVYGTPDFNECEKYYRVSDGDALRSFIKREKKDGAVHCVNGAELRGQQKAMKKNRKTPLKMLLREMVWKYGNWKNKHLKKWIEEVNPSCILVVAGDNRFLLDFAVKIAKERNIPVVLYSTEEYPFKDYNYVTKRFSIFYLIWRKYLRKGYRKIVKHVKAGIFNSEALMNLYEKEYGYKCYYIYQASDINWIDNYQIQDNITVSYLGNLGLNRHKALIDVATVINEILPGTKLNIYGRVNEEIKKELENCTSISFKGFIPYEQVVDIIHNSTLLVHAEFNDEFYNRDLKYAFSTKITDSVCSGTPFLIYASDELVETKFLREHNCAFVASSKSELIEQLRLALTDENVREEISSNAKEVKEKYFTNVGKLNEIIKDVLNESTSN